MISVVAIPIYFFWITNGSFCTSDPRGYSPRHELYGIYHIASQPISKFDLLKLVAQKYGKSVKIVPDDKIVTDRSLSSEKFTSATGYSPPDWATLIEIMHSYKYGLTGN